MALLLLNEDELRQTIPLSEAIEAVERAFAALAEGRLHIPGAFSMNLPDVKGEVHVKGIYLHETPYYVIQASSNFLENPFINLPVHSGLTVVFDAATGFPAAILVDNGYLSTIRAGAVGALAANYLANKELAQVAVIGTSDQAYMQLKALVLTCDVDAVQVWAPSPAKADVYARSMVEDHNINIDIAPSVEDAASAADLIIIATRSQQPLIQAEWLKPGVHLTAVHSNTPNPQKLHTDVLKRANVIVTDNLNQSVLTGEIRHSLQAGIITRSDVQGELSDLITNKIPGRTDPTQITVADLTGLEVQDTVLATLALEKALFLGLGQRVESQL